MRWLSIKRAEIDPEFRALFETRGIDTVRAYIGMPGYPMRVTRDRMW